jgi:hypothetical protein
MWICRIAEQVYDRTLLAEECEVMIERDPVFYQQSIGLTQMRLFLAVTGTSARYAEWVVWVMCMVCVWWVVGNSLCAWLCSVGSVVCSSLYVVGCIQSMCERSLHRTAMRQYYHIHTTTWE